MIKTERKNNKVNLYFKENFNDFLNFNWFQRFIILRVIRKGEIHLSSGNIVHIEILEDIISIYPSDVLTKQDKSECDLIRYRIGDSI